MGVRGAPHLEQRWAGVWRSHTPSVAACLPCSVTLTPALLRCRYLAWRSVWSWRPRGLAWYRLFAALWLALRPSRAQTAPQYTFPRSQRPQMTTCAEQRAQ